jgi:hypothetical protein
MSDTEAAGTFWSNERLHRTARIATLVFAGMILGALLASAWFVEQAKNQHRANDAKTSVFISECAYPAISG